MRTVWAVLAIIIVGAVVVVTQLDMLSAKSAPQASQLYDGATMTILAVIAVTLALWFARRE